MFISAVDYYQVNESIESNYEKQRINAKESIEDSIRLIDNRNTVLSDIFSNQMEENSKPFLEAYNETAPNIEDIELNTDSYTIEFESGSTIAYQSETPTIEADPKPPHEQRLPGEEPDMTLVNAIMREKNRSVELSVGGQVEIECLLSYEEFLRL